MSTGNKRTSERVIRMKKSFMELHNAGNTIPEIAKLFNLDFGTVYRHLQEIADENNVTREDLLIKPLVRHTPKSTQSKSKKSECNNVSFDEISTSLNSVLSGLKSLIATIDDVSEKMSKE